MTEKQKIISGLQQYNKGAGVITQSQVARYLGTRPDRDRVKRLVKDLKAYEESPKKRYYLVTDVAEAYIRTAR